MTNGTDTAKTYTITSRSDITNYNERTGRVESGLEVTVAWHANETEFTLFIPGDPPSAQAVDEAIRARGARDDEYEQLGA